MTALPTRFPTARRLRGVRRMAMVVLVGATGLVLSACTADIHPGSAAVVDGTSISESRINTLVTAGCAYETEMGKIDPQTYPVLSISSLRANFVNVLIRNQLARDAAAKIGGLRVSQDQVMKFAAGNTIPPDLAEPEKSQIKDFFMESAETDLLVALIGAHLKDDTVTDASNVQQADLDAGQKYLTTYAKTADVSVNPSLGTWNGTTLEPGSGSLSVLAVTPTTPEAIPGQPAANPATTLPPSQQCG